MTRVVVVGAGAAGCVVAARLAERPGTEVVLIEAGAGTTAEASRSSSFFDAAAAPGRTYPGDFLRGRGVGGSSAINGMIATAGDDAQYRAWGWSDMDEAVAQVRVPFAAADDHELGPVDRALRAAAPDTTPALLTRRAGTRVTAFDAYLAGGDPLAQVLAESSVERILFDGDRAAAVTTADGTTVEADAVVLCAGAIGSPVLLARSGIDVPGIGRGLRNHAATPITLQLRPGVDQDIHGLVAATFLRRDDVQVLAVNHLGPDAAGQAGFLVVAMAPTGRGTVSVGDDGAVVRPVVSSHDHERLAAGVAMVEQLLDHPAFRSIVDDVAVGEPPAGVYHPTSTCRMGEVVDDDGALVGRDHLFVVDASIFPDIPTANPYLPTLALAERMAGRVWQRVAASPR